MKLIVVACALVSGLLVVCLITSSLAIAQPAAGDDAARPNIVGKIVIISFKSDASATATLEKVRLDQIAGQKFLVGEAVDDGTPRSWNKGRTTWVSLDDVAQLIEFPDVETMKKAIKSYSDRDEVF